MILTGNELQSYVDAEEYADRFVPLHVDDIKLFRSNIRVTETGFDCGVEASLDKYNDEYRLESGVYRVSFRESASFPEGVVPVIYPSSNALMIGCIAYPRYVTDGEMWDLVAFHKNASVEDNAVVAILMAWDTNKYSELEEQLADVKLGLSQMESKDE